MADRAQAEDLAPRVRAVEPSPAAMITRLVWLSRLGAPVYQRRAGERSCCRSVHPIVPGKPRRSVRLRAAENFGTADSRRPAPRAMAVRRNPGVARALRGWRDGVALLPLRARSRPLRFRAFVRRLTSGVRASIRSSSTSACRISGTLNVIAHVTILPRAGERPGPTGETLHPSRRTLLRPGRATARLASVRWLSPRRRERWR